MSNTDTQKLPVTVAVPRSCAFGDATAVRLSISRQFAPLGVPTPIHRFIATALKPFVNGHARR